MTAIRDLNIIDGPTIWVVTVLAVLLAVYLLARPLTRRWVLTAGSGMAAGAVVALGLYLWLSGTEVFGLPLPFPVAVLSMAALAAVGLAVVNLWRSRWWRKVLAVVGIMLFTVTGTLGVNRWFGLDPTVGSLFGTVSEQQIVLPASSSVRGHHERSDPLPLYRTWTPPASMPTKGTVGEQVIPATVSGFAARPAGIYLPPAALVADPPALPLVIMMMGYPGNPDPSYIGAVLDDFAARHDGLAPIVVVADQIGTDGDPACADSGSYGHAETYVKTDVVDWARKNLNVSLDPQDWVIAGFSNGGGCAIKYGAQDPQTFRNILDISGEEFPGSETYGIVDQIYGGDQAKFESLKPAAILAANKGRYDGVTAVFTAGADDTPFVNAAQKVSDAAKAAGMRTTFDTIPGAGHVVDALNGGLVLGFTVLYPVLGLSAT